MTRKYFFGSRNTFNIAKITLSMQEKIAQNKGLQLDRAGILINNHLFPPESFATGYIGARTSPLLLDDLAAVAKKSKASELDIERTPLLKKILFGSNSQPNAGYALGQIAEWVDKKNGKQTFISEPAAMEVNGKRELATRSAAENISMRIRSRTKPSSHWISLYNAAGTSIDTLANFEAQGGARNTEVSRARGTHWRSTSYRDSLYLDSLTKEQHAQYTQPVGLIDYTRAAALISLSDIARTNSLQIGGGARDERINTTLLPWQFENAPQFAFEVVARQFAPKKALEAAGLDPERATDAQMDRYLLANSDAGFVSEQALTMIERGFARRSATISRRYFPDESWSIIQALEKHMLAQGREFAGYTLEFRGTRYETVGIRFEFPDTHSANRKKSAVIIYDDNFGLPFIMYKTRGLSEFEKNTRLGAANPTGFVNISIDRRKIGSKPFQEWDWATKSRANETIFEPTYAILHAATNIAAQSTRGAIMTPYDWRGKYIDLSSQRRFKVEARN